MEASRVSTPKPTNHSGMEVAMTRIFFAPDSTSCRTRCAPRKPVPPVIRVVGGIFLTMAACFFVLFFGTICAVLFFVLVTIQRVNLSVALCVFVVDLLGKPSPQRHRGTQRMHRESHFKLLPLRILHRIQFVPGRCAVLLSIARATPSCRRVHSCDRAG